MNRTIGFIGLGRMGSSMVLHLVEKGVDVVVYNRSREKADELQKIAPSIRIAQTLQQLTDILPSPRIIFLMVPNGQPIDDVLGELHGLTKDDVIIDGGNTFYKDTVKRSVAWRKQGISYIDCGTSGGIEGARNGACLMLGGDKSTVETLSWLWDALGTWGYMGSSGAGHFVKMVHNGIEYGMDEALGEGFELLARGPYPLDLGKVSEAYSKGSVIRGWIMELLTQAFKKDPKLSQFSGTVGGGQTGAWASEAAQELGVETPVMDQSLAMRKKTLTKPSFAGKVISALRFGYGGHKEPK